MRNAEMHAAPPAFACVDIATAPPEASARYTELIQIGLATLAAILFVVQLLSTPGIPGGDDGYRHARIAWLMAHDFKGVLADPWHLVYFWPKPVDAWFGYHILLLPLTLVFTPIVAAKMLAGIIFGGIAYVSQKLLALAEVIWPAAWLVLLLTGSAITLHRAMLARPFLLSILLVLATALFTLQHRSLAVGIASAVHASCYSMFFLAALAPIAYLVIRRDRVSVRLMLASAAGLIAGLLCSPYFPQNAIFEFWVTVGPAALGAANNVKIGGELRPLTIWWLVASIPVMIAWIASLVVFARRRFEGARTETAMLLLISSGLTLLASIRVGRTFDYFTPFAVLFAAVVLTPWIRGHRKEAQFAASILLLFCGVNVVMNAMNVKETISPDRFRGVSGYLQQHAENSIVVNSRWEQYPFLYFWNPGGRYLVGIEPTFMLLQDARKYWLWRHVSDDEITTCDREKCTSGSEQDIPITLVRELGAGYVLIERDRNPQLGSLLANSPLFTEVYQDPVCRLFAARQN